MNISSARHIHNKTIAAEHIFYLSMIYRVTELYFIAYTQYVLSPHAVLFYKCTPDEITNLDEKVRYNDNGPLCPCFLPIR
jgi:hypothetical protein